VRGRPAGITVKDDAPIILECPACETRYEVPVSIPEGGRKVRCAKCANVWTVQPGDELRRDEVSPPEDFDDEEGDVIFRDDAELEPETGPPLPPPEEEEATVATAEPPPDAAVEIDELAGVEPDQPAEAEFDVETQPETGDEALPEAGFDVDFDAVSEDLAVREPEDEDAAADAESERDEVAEFYGDQPEAGETGEAGAESIVIGKARRRFRLSGRLTAAWAGLILAVVAFGALAVNQRSTIVRALPGSAWVFAAIGMPVNVRGLDFLDVAYSWETDAGRIVLEVHGDIINVTDQELPVPPVVFALRDQVEKEIYKWEEEVMGEPLAPRGRAAFAIRIPTPPKSIKSVQVRFAKAR
jgi:predicted Zn finger-like uncharacterized protein